MQTRHINTLPVHFLPYYYYYYYYYPLSMEGIDVYLEGKGKAIPLGPGQAMRVPGV